MAQSIRTDGDPIERAYVDLIESRLPSYEKVWAAFIGNDGSSRLPATAGEDPAVTERRQFTSQDIYTVLVSVICAQRAAEKRSSVKTVPDLMDAVDRLVLFYGHVGRVRDCFLRLGPRWGLPELAAPLERLYQERNSALHDTLPAVDDLFGQVAFVPPGGDEIPGRWSRRRKWSETDQLDFEPLVEFLQSSFDELLPLVESCFARLHSAIRDQRPQDVFRIGNLAPLTTASPAPSASLGSASVMLGNLAEILPPPRKKRKR